MAPAPDWLDSENDLIQIEIPNIKQRTFALKFSIDKILHCTDSSFTNSHLWKEGK